MPLLCWFLVAPGCFLLLFGLLFGPVAWFAAACLLLLFGSAIRARLFILYC
jgi:hypothetical protein